MPSLRHWFANGCFLTFVRYFGTQYAFPRSDATSNFSFLHEFLFDYDSSCSVTKLLCSLLIRALTEGF